jgi:hypothetical protein
MLDLEYDLKQLCRHNRDGSRMTQAHRMERLRMIARELHGLGFRHLRASSLKPKHVEALVGSWQEKGLSTGTIKNRMADLRWWAEKAGRHAAVAADNAHYGIDSRTFTTASSKAMALQAGGLSLIDDERVRMSLRLQAAFGLRREDAIKFSPAYADRGDRLVLKDSWCKGGRAREIPVRTQAQRELLDECHALAGSGSLIPTARSYIEQRRVYERHTARAGLSKLHGLRHAYAQARYQDICGWRAPAAGGPRWRELSPQQKQQDQAARVAISRELGHERERITAVYLGR